MKAWRDICAVFDDGTYAVRDYAALEQRLVEQKRKFSGGLGCLVVIPPGSQRIQDDVRNEIDRVLNAISVRCLCWAVLETGFRGASIRAIVTAMNLFGTRRKYPTLVTGSLEEALTWLLPQLEGGASRRKEVAECVEFLTQHLTSIDNKPAAVS